MRPRQTKTPNVRAAAGAFLAAVLALAVAAGAVPAASALGARGCPMPCCKGADGTPGDCEGGSCPVSHIGGAEAAPSKPADADHSGHAGGDASSHEGGGGAHHAETGRAPSHAHAPSHARDADGVEHSSRAGVSPRDISNSSPGASAALSKPCPPDCGGLPTSSTQLRRGRDEAALSYKLRPLPPGGKVLTRAAFGVTENSSVLRRQYPPRAPPTVSAGRPA